MSSNDDLKRAALRHPDVLVPSFKHHLSRVVGRPIRTILAIAITYVFAVGFVAFSMDPDTTRETLQGEPGLGDLIAILPPTTYLVILGLLAVVGIPIGMVTNGVRRDLTTPHRRRRYRDR